MPDQPPEKPLSETPTDPGLGPDPRITRVLEIARSLIGQKEQGQNKGPIIELVVQGTGPLATMLRPPFLSPDRYRAALAAGKLEWCAAFVWHCYICIEPRLRQYVSLEVSTTWFRCSVPKWTRRQVPGMPPLPLPRPGDLMVFGYRSNPEKPRHIELVADVGKRIHTVGGNRRADPSDTGSVGEGIYTPEDPTIFGYITPVLPPPLYVA